MKYRSSSLTGDGITMAVAAGAATLRKTIEGNLNSTVRRINYRYNANPKRKYYNMSVVPENEITQENCQYTLQKDDWYVTGFCATW